jgi:hypothetical protein
MGEGIQRMVSPGNTDATVGAEKVSRGTEQIKI